MRAVTSLSTAEPETIVRRRCAALIPYARNARTHSDQQVAQIAASIREFGFTNPVLIDEEDGISRLGG
jgi:ParB-like chromosome segregation protein Spo0J